VKSVHTFSFVKPHAGRPGSLLIEALLAIALFAVFATATFLVLLTGQEGSQEGADRMRGMHYTQEALEVAQSIRNSAFEELVPGQHGYTLDENGAWILTGSSLERSGYTTSMLIEPINSDKKRITARTIWKHGYHRSGAIVLSMEITDWRARTGDLGDWSLPQLRAEIDLSGGSIPFLNDIAVYDEYVFVTSSAAGKGLYIFDVSDPESPLRLSNTFMLGAASHKAVVYKNTLYLAVEGIGDELQAFDISNPAGLDSSTVPRATYNVPGGGRVRALVRYGSILFVGATGMDNESEFYAFDISNPDSIALIGELAIEDDATVNDIFLRGQYAYLATSRDAQELIVIDVTNPSDMRLHAAYNAVDAQDGTAVRGTATSFYIGRAYGSAIDEFLLITGSEGVPSSNPIDTYGADMGSAGEGHVHAMDIDLLGCYAFIATDFSQKQLQIRSAASTEIPELAYRRLAGPARGVRYDPMKDRLYVATNTGFHIFTAPDQSPCL